MIEVILTNRKVDDILVIVKELRSQGLVQRQDFDFKWRPAIHDWLGGTEEPSQTIFYFYKESLATMFKLRWA